MNDPKYFVSFFSGGGGFDLGLTEAGFRPTFCSDIEEFARASHAANYPNIPFLQKIFGPLHPARSKALFEGRRSRLYVAAHPAKVLPPWAISFLPTLGMLSLMHL